MLKNYFENKAKATRRCSAALMALIFMSGAAGLWAQDDSPIAIESSIDRSNITIGDTVQYTVRLTRLPEVEIVWPGLAANLDQFEIRRYQPPTARRNDDKIIEEAHYTISTYIDTGAFVIPPLTVRYRVPPDSTWHELSTEALEIYVRSILPSEAGDILGIKAPWELPKDWRTVILWSAAGVGVLLLALAGYLFWRRRQGKGLLPVKAAPLRPAHELALAELQQLRESDLLASGEIKLYYSILSEILRRYIEGRFGVVALEMTTTEVLTDLSRNGYDTHGREQLSTVLTESDLVKFAKLIPPEEQHGALLGMAEEYIELTKPVAQAVSATAIESSPQGPASQRAEREPETTVVEV